MCFGLPMRVISVNGGLALCEAGSLREHVDLALVGTVKPGSFLLVHLGTAHRALDEEEAGSIANAIEAVRAAASGEPFEHLIADLVDREPELPPHLQNQDNRRNSR